MGKHAHVRAQGTYEKALHLSLNLVLNQISLKHSLGKQSFLVVIDKK